MAGKKERYTLFVKPFLSDYYKKDKHEEISCKTLKEAKNLFGILTENEKKISYIWDNVKKCRVEA